MKILVAEDDLSCQEITGYLLEQWGYEFDLAENGQMAVDLARRNGGQYDLCMMDINMPIIDGPEAAERIRRETSYFPILAMSMDPRNEKKCLESGMDDFIEKTYTFDELYYKITELTVKSLKINFRDKNLDIRKEMPVDSEHLNELRKLREKGLTKLSIRGNGCEVVVDERVQNKISYDLIGKKQELSEFLDRSEDKPGICHLYKSNFMMNTKYLLPDEFEKYKNKEDNTLKECESTIVKPLDD